MRGAAIKLGFLVVLVGAAIGIDFALREIFNPHWLRLIELAGIHVVIAVGLNLINGYCGQFSIGHAGFWAIGAYASGVLLTVAEQKWGTPSAVVEILLLVGGMAIAAILAGAAGLLVGIPSLRLRGDYLAIATLGFGEIIRNVIVNVDAIGGPRGYHGIPVYTNAAWCIIVAALAIWFSRNLVTSSFGRALVAVREDEVAAEAVGINTTRVKVIAFVVSAMMTGAAGALYAHLDGSLDPDTFKFTKSIEFIIMITVGGLGSITGAVFGAIVLTLLPELLREIHPTLSEYRMVIYSALLIVIVLVRPKGLLGNRELSPSAGIAWLRRKFGKGTA
ncbi:MAG: branched-chain amino acid ABC transporter permease [Deltaproteobacteria bacterium]|nr:branched-chain amino acid ABC transporter permease [Deltaproteobacteria bacterium]